MIHFHKKNHKIGLDIDDVLADFRKGYSEYAGRDFTKEENFLFSYQTMDKLAKVDDDFWINMPSKVDGRTLSFHPTCYISSRSIDVRLTETWLEKNGFPCVPVIHTNDISKLEACRKMGVDVFVDDYIKNFQELHEGGIEAILMDAHHNRQYNVDPYRIFDINELPKKLIELGL